MLKKTAIALGLVIASGSAMAVDDNDSNQATTGSVTASSSVMAQFNKLDTNDDNVVSKSEAQASPRVAQMFESLTTDNSIKTDPAAEPSDTQPGGITLQQFKAGLEAASGGTAGQAVSGGESYTVMKDGTKKMSDARKMGQDMKSHAASMGHETAAGAKQMGDDAMSGAKQMGHDAKQMGHDAMHKAGDRMKNAGGMSGNADASVNAGANGASVDAESQIDGPSVETKPTMSNDAMDADDMGDNGM